MAWTPVTTKGIIRSVHVDRFYDWVNGTGGNAANFNGTFTHTSDSSWVQDSGALANVFAIQGETSYRMHRLVRGTTGSTAMAQAPLVNIQLRHRPNQDTTPTDGVPATYATGVNWLMKTIRDGGDAGVGGTNGNVVSEWNVASVISSNSIYEPSSGRGHDISALVGIALALGVGYRQGTVNSKALAYGLYVEAETLSPDGQGLNEIKVTNSSGGAARHWYDSGYAKKTVGLQIVADRDYSSGGATSSTQNGVGLWIRTALNSDDTRAFWEGIAFEAASVKAVAIDARALASTVIPLLIAPASSISALNGNNTATIKLHGIETTSDVHNIYLGTYRTTAGADTDLQFMLQSGTTVAAMSPVGIWDFKNTTSAGTAPIATVTGAGTTAFVISFTPGGVGQPSGNTVTDWLKVRKAGALRFSPLLS